MPLQEGIETLTCGRCILGVDDVFKIKRDAYHKMPLDVAMK